MKRWPNLSNQREQKGVNLLQHVIPAKQTNNTVRYEIEDQLSSISDYEAWPKYKNMF